MSVNRLKIAFDKKITKGIKRVIPRVLAETKRREVNADGLISESQYIREGGAYSTPQNNIPRYEALNIKETFRSPDKECVTNIMENQRGSIQADPPETLKRPPVEFQSNQEIKNNKKIILQNDKFYSDNIKYSNK